MDPINLEQSAKDGELTLVFDRASKVFLQIQDEIADLERRFGTASSFVKHKRFQLECMIEMQDAAAKEINKLTSNRDLYERALKLADVNLRAYQKICFSLQTRIPTSKLDELYRS